MLHHHLHPRPIRPPTKNPSPDRGPPSPHPTEGQPPSCPPSKTILENTDRIHRQRSGNLNYLPPRRPLHAIKKTLHTALAGARANLVPGIVLWAVATLVVAAYHLSPQARAALGHVADLKTAGGYTYAAVATAVAGGLVPFLVLLARGRVPRGQVAAQLLFYLVFWAWRGIEVDALYRLQSHLFGDRPDAVTITIKTVIDQFGYCPFWAAPVTALFYTWKDAGFSRPAVREALRGRFYRDRVAPVLLSTWLVWIPAVALIYALPLPLQVPLFNLVLCFFVLLIAALDPPAPQGAG